MNKSNTPKQFLATIILSTLALLVAIISFAFHFIDKPTIVYIDSIALMNGYKGMQEAKGELEKKIALYQQNIDTLKMEYQQKIMEYERKKKTLSTSEQQLFEELLASKEQQLTGYQQMVQEKIQSENQILSQKVLSKINDYVKRFGKENKADLILTATQYGNIAYGDESVEITDKIIAGLNAEYFNEKK